MQYTRAKIIRILLEYFVDDDRRIEHAMLVLHHAENITAEYNDYDMDIVIATALLHDVGIKPAEKIHGYNTGKMQEEYGPEEAEKLLQKIDFPAEKIEIVKKIIGNHHSPSQYNYPELEILKAADLIVNTAN